MDKIFEIINYKSNNQEEVNTINNESINNVKNSEPDLFTVEKFIEKIKTKSIVNKFNRLIHSNSITAYDIASTCIRSTIYRLLNYPIKSFEDSWLPVAMRQVIGTAIHDFIQSNYSFEQEEVVVKISDFNFSGRVDAINGNNVLIEIKSVSYPDYEKIISSNKPRTKDLYQTLIYKYLLENYIDKIRDTQSNTEKEYNWPKYDNYKISHIQFIYIAHDIVSADFDSINDVLFMIKTMKKQLNSRNNKFFFIKTITIEVEKHPELKEIEEMLFDKLLTINEFYNKHVIPSKDNKYVSESSCFFCPYKDVCK